VSKATVDLQTVDGSMRAFEARPDGDARGAVVVIQEAFGVNDHIRGVTERFAGAGYHSVAPELYHRADTDPVVAYDDIGAAVKFMSSLTDEGMLTDLDATLEHLRGAGFERTRTGIVGFCMGGRVTFLAAARRTLGAAVGFYGGGIVTARMPQLPPLVDEATTLRTPWLGLFGDIDQSIPVTDVETLRTAAAVAPVDTDVVRYANAGHGFFNDEREAYEPEAAADGWQRTLAWLARLERPAGSAPDT
jgi:carboxymethylenebutenolidase